MDYLSIKSLHIIFIVTWFAGLFYIVRLFIYHVESQGRPGDERRILGDQFKLMARRLWYIITWPSAVLTLIFGSLLLYNNPYLLQQPFMHIKLSFVVLLYLYHLGCHRLFTQLQKDIFRYSATQLRLWNEASTIILIAVVFLIVKRNEISWIWGTLGIFAVAFIFMIAVKLYKRYREKSGQ